jgi:Photosynthesis system II assembly factor YCF48
VKDESAREKALDKLVREKLRAQAAAPAGACPEASILAAYVERALAPGERTRWEAHFASCARCQEQIAALVRLSEEDEPVARPAPARRRVAGFRWAWAASVLLAVTVAGLWYTGEFKSRLKQNVETISIPARPPASAPPTASEGKQPIPPATAEKKRAETPPAATRRVERMKRPVSEVASANAPLPTSPEASGAARQAARQEVMSAEVEKPGQAPRPPAAERGSGPPLPPAPRDQMAAPMAVAPSVTPPSERAERARKPQAAGEAGTVGALSDRALTPRAPSAPAAEAQTVEVRKSPALRKSLVQAEGMAAPRSGLHYARARPVESMNPASPPLWRVGPRGLIEKMAQGSWVERPSGVTEDLLDVTFPRAQAGWIVGRHGTVLRSTDVGETWERAKRPTDEDLVRVTAQSAESAQVTARSGAVFATTDGGKSWHLSRPQ